MAMSAIASQSSRVSDEPHGLCGELMISSFVRSVTSRASSSVSMRNSLSSRSGIGTPVAPANAVIDSYIGKAGVLVQHLVALAAQRHDRVEHDRLGTRRHDHLVRRGPHPAVAFKEVDHGLAQGRDARRRERSASARPAAPRPAASMMCGAVGKSGSPISRWMILLSGGLHGPGPGQDFEGGFGSEPAHAVCQGHCRHGPDDTAALIGGKRPSVPQCDRFSTDPCRRPGDTSAWKSVRHRR